MVLARLFGLSLKSLVISWLPRQAEVKSDEIVAQKHIKSDRLALTMMHKPVVSDTLNYNTTFGPPFVFVKVSQHISVCNLFFTPKRPACVVSLSVSANPLYINVAQVAHGHCTGKQRNAKFSVAKS